jgi:hypothetical protein
VSLAPRRGYRWRSGSGDLEPTAGRASRQVEDRRPVPERDVHRSSAGAEFRTAVELTGHRWPDGWVKGSGWQERGPASGRVLASADVSNGLEGYFVHQRKRVLRGKVKPYTIYRAEQAFALHLEPTFGGNTLVGLEQDAISHWVDEQVEFGAARSRSGTGTGCCPSIVKHRQLRLRLRPDKPVCVDGVAGVADRSIAGRAGAVLPARGVGAVPVLPEPGRVAAARPGALDRDAVG